MTLNRNTLVRRAATISVNVAVILIIFKLMAWWETDSISLKASLIDSILDATASIINLFAIRQAQQPADKTHRFGYGKSEALSAVGQSIFVSGSAIWLLLEIIQRFHTPQNIQETTTGVWVMILSIILTTSLIAFQTYVIKKTNSTAIKAESIHYKSDLLINIAVLFVLISHEHTNLILIDPILGGIISMYILWTAIKIIREALKILMDRELDNNIRNKIKNIVLSHPKSKGIHDLRTRNSGVNIFIQFHLELEGKLTLYDSHDISYEIKKELIKQFPSADILIHKDPEDVKETRQSFL